jgi:hypothetical protein
MYSALISASSNFKNFANFAPLRELYVSRKGAKLAKAQVRVSRYLARIGIAIALLIILNEQVCAQEPKIRASLANQSDAWVGEPRTLIVELLAPGFFAGAPAFDLPDPQGTILVPPRGSPTISSEEIDGTSYTVQRHELSIVARRAGAQTIPPLTVRFRYKRQPLDKDSSLATVKTVPLTFAVKTPPGAERLGGIISARDLTVTEQWQPEPGDAKAGDAFTRTITFSAPDVPAMAFPPFPAAKIDGLGVYPKPPDVVDHSDRGNLRGERRDTITYLCKQPGQYIIPAVRLSWFDLESQKIQTIDLAARSITVAPNPALAAAEATSESTRDGLASLRRVGAFLWYAIPIAVCLALVYRNWTRWTSPFRAVPLAPLNPGGED